VSTRRISRTASFFSTIGTLDDRKLGACDRGILATHLLPAFMTTSVLVRLNMTPLPHRYHVQLTGGASGYAQLSAAGLPRLQTAPPMDYDGPGDAWSPEHLLLAAIQTCFLFTFRATARLSQFEFERVDINATGTVDRVDGVTRFTDVVLRVSLAVPPGTNHERALRVLERSEHRCLVAASVSAPVHLEPTIYESESRELVGHGTAHAVSLEP
jgi:organic hydroperoxide reductase OsmC/OhrA